MALDIKKNLKSYLPDILGTLLRLPQESIRITRKQRDVYRIDAGASSFLALLKHSGATAPISAAVEQVRSCLDNAAAIPLIIVPYMGGVGRRICSEANISWVDLSGNASIVAPGLLIHVEGRPNRFKKVGRPGNVFAPKSSRVVRQLLIDCSTPYTQRQLARATGLGDSFVSRIVRRLEQDGLVTRMAASGDVKVRDPGLLLDAWHEAYDFKQHHILPGHLLARTGPDLIQQLASSLTDRSVDYAATGLAAAWMMSRYAGFRLTTVYLREYPTDTLLQEIEFRNIDSGANTWLVVPRDDGVFNGSQLYDGVRCVHPTQVYLDLKGHPERSKDAAQELRRQPLSYGNFFLKIGEINRKTLLSQARDKLDSDDQTLSLRHTKLILEDEFRGTSFRTILDLKTFRHKARALEFKTLEDGSLAVVADSLRQCIEYNPQSRLVEGMAVEFSGDSE